MNFTYLFKKYRKTEPTSVFALRVIFMLLLMIIATIYIAILVLNFVSQNSRIREEEFKEVENILLPDLEFSAGFKFNITCSFSDNKTDDRCTTYIKNYNNSKLNYGYFRPSDKYVFTPPGSSGISKLMITISTNNINSSDLTINVYDAEFNPNNNQQVTNTQYDPNSTFSKFTDSLNKYYLRKSNVYTLRISKNQKQTFAPDGFNVIPRYNKQNYYTTILDGYQNLTGNANNTFCIIQVEPTSFIMRIETERRVHSVFELIGLIGGAWVLISGFYALLFGSDLIRPWGLIQTYICGFSSRNKLLHSFPSLPLVMKGFKNNKNSSTTNEENNNNHNNNNYINDLEILQNQLTSLQLFLRDYVVDVNYLENIQRKNNLSPLNNNDNNDNNKDHDNKDHDLENKNDDIGRISIVPSMYNSLSSSSSSSPPLSSSQSPLSKSPTRISSHSHSLSAPSSTLLTTSAQTSTITAPSITNSLTIATRTKEYKNMDEYLSQTGLGYMSSRSRRSSNPVSLINAFGDDDDDNVVNNFIANHKNKNKNNDDDNNNDGSSDGGDDDEIASMRQSQVLIRYPTIVRSSSMSKIQGQNTLPLCISEDEDDPI